MLDAAGREVALHPARNHAIHHQAMAEARARSAQDLLAQQAAAGMHDAEGRVVADGADIAEVVRQALEFARERPQPRRARWNLSVERILDRARVSERVGD